MTEKTLLTLVAIALIISITLSFVNYFSLPLVYIDNWSGECKGIEIKGKIGVCGPLPNKYIIVYITGDLS